MNPKTFQITVKKGPRLGEAFELTKDEIIIGRDTTLDISFEISEVSRRHAAITRVGDEYFVKDLGSTNGTFVNKKRVKDQHRLKIGDVIMLSDEVYLVVESQFDPGATMVAPPPFANEEQKTEYAPPPAFTPAPVRVPAPVSAPPKPKEQYAGRIPVSPAMLPEIPEEGKKKTWIWAGVGCLAVMIFLFVIGLILFDALDFYCTPPFDKLFGFLYTCP